MTATAMINAELGTSCGGFTYTLEFVSGDLSGSGIDPLSAYTLTENGVGGTVTISGTPGTLDWAGTNTYRIKCTNGHSSNAPRGDGLGLYNSVYSNSFDIIMENPCLSSLPSYDTEVSIGDLVATS